MEQGLWESFFTLVGGEVSLKSLRQIVNYLLEFIEKPTTSSKDIARVISADPALSAKVITIVNSPAMGLRNKISDLPYAITLMGYDQIRDIVLSVNIVEKMGKREEQQFIRLWKHSFYCAKVAEIIAKIVGKPAGEAFTLGLLHDIGKILLGYSNQMAFSSALNNYKYQAGKALHWQSEKQVFGMTHAEIGALAVSYWKMPTLLYEGIWHHHSPRTTALNSLSEQMAQIVYVADTLCWTLGHPSVNSVNPYAGANSETCVQENLLAPIGLNRISFRDVAAKAKAAIAKSETVFQWMEQAKPSKEAS